MKNVINSSNKYLFFSLFLSYFYSTIHIIKILGQNVTLVFNIWAFIGTLSHVDFFNQGKKLRIKLRFWKSFKVFHTDFKLLLHF